LDAADAWQRARKIQKKLKSAATLKKTNKPKKDTDYVYVSVNDYYFACVPMLIYSMYGRY